VLCRRQRGLNLGSKVIEQNGTHGDSRSQIRGRWASCSQAKKQGRSDRRERPYAEYCPNTESLSVIAPRSIQEFPDIGAQNEMIGHSVQPGTTTPFEKVDHLRCLRLYSSLQIFNW